MSTPQQTARRVVLRHHPARRSVRAGAVRSASRATQRSAVISPNKSAMTRQLTAFCGLFEKSMSGKVVVRVGSLPQQANSDHPQIEENS